MAIDPIFPRNLEVENPREALEQTRRPLKRSPVSAEIYVNTANSIPVMQALEERGFAGKTKVISIILPNRKIELK